MAQRRAYCILLSRWWLEAGAVTVSSIKPTSLPAPLKSIRFRIGLVARVPDEANRLACRDTGRRDGEHQRYRVPGSEGLQRVVRAGAWREVRLGAASPGIAFRTQCCNRPSQLLG